ncbi:iron compound ABC transporter ATP-binding protein [Glycocaulis alkaliphilus]|uniref:Iron compound ABC transporter ATP-binding protein n=1 Tax=Glycocaulis alkaliphilus TaxID=1434191 RepID=A0A3T0E8B7_9PROT|nr:ABC transporter ATP-binding protein [Glycocaulis alkaliphilus]AZU03457.1 iron compound ABC transporter ATP-binding protein [Glycocaulis alkaliphilus]GGB73635.1 ABC transporter [Glycocaulis alkaliphilus]
MSTRLAIIAASAGHDARTVLSDVTFCVQPGELICLVGPNGAGKSTLLKLAAGILPARTGEVRLGGRDASAMSARARAAHMAWLAQERGAAWAMRGVDIAALGRFAHEGRPYERLPDAARESVNAAIERCGASGFAHRPVDTLSGGEKARIHLARTLAGGAPLLLLDEPLNALDPRHQLDVMALLRAEAASGTAIILALHDLAMARRHAARVIVLDEGRIVADGPPATALSSTILANVFAVREAPDGGFSPV